MCDRWVGNFIGMFLRRMETIEVTARMKSPIILGGGYLTLDALLAAILFEQSGDIEHAHGSVPLVNTDGLFHASAAIFEPFSTDGVAFVANMRAAHSLNPSLLLKDKRGNVHRKIGLTRRRDFGAVMNSYKSFDALEITWYAEGDAAKVEELLSDIKFIGKRRHSGFGEVSGWQVDTGDLNGVVGSLGQPLRPVPIDMFNGDPSSLKVDAAWRPAYWHPENRAMCYAPEIIQ